MFLSSVSSSLTSEAAEENLQSCKRYSRNESNVLLCSFSRVTTGMVDPAGKRLFCRLFTYWTFLLFLLSCLTKSVTNQAPLNLGSQVTSPLGGGAPALWKVSSEKVEGMPHLPHYTAVIYSSSSSSLVALRRDVNLTVNAVRKWLVQEGQELEMGIRRW